MVERAEGEEAKQSKEMALRLSSALVEFWDVRGHRATLVRTESDLTAAVRDVECGDKFQLVRPKPEIDRNMRRITSDRESKDRRRLARNRS